MDLSKMKYAYKAGKNPAGDRAYYSCGHCDLMLVAEEVGYVAAGTTYANGEFSPCPNCGNENSVDRDEDSE